jgi:hypothetical protein
VVGDTNLIDKVHNNGNIKSYATPKKESRAWLTTTNTGRDKWSTEKQLILQLKFTLAPDKTD